MESEVRGISEKSTNEGGRALRIEVGGAVSKSKSKPEMSAAPVSRTSLMLRADDNDVEPGDGELIESAAETIDLDRNFAFGGDVGDKKLPARVTLLDLEDVVAAAKASGMTEKRDDRRDTG
jgi:hypothetical protein